MSTTDAESIDTTDLVESLRAELGTTSAPTAEFRDPVNRARIHLWCDAMEDQNLVYLDEDFAAESVFGGIVAPPTALQAWGFSGVCYPETNATPAETAVGKGFEYPEMLADAGFIGVVATNCEQEYVRYLRPGDRLRSVETLEGISDLKQTLVGRGIFTTTRTTYLDQNDLPVGHHMFRILYYLPNTGKVIPNGNLPDLSTDDLITAVRQPPRMTTRSFDSVTVDESLPELILPLTPTRIVATAIASGDYQDVHHDRDAAIRRGMKDIFMNILTSNGTVGRYITDWTGPDAVLRSVAIRLGATNYPYDAMRVNGHVVSKEATGQGGIVTVAVTGRNRLGDHVVGTVRLSLPGN